MLYIEGPDDAYFEVQTEAAKVTVHLVEIAEGVQLTVGNVWALNNSGEWIRASKEEFVYKREPNRSDLFHILTDFTEYCRVHRSGVTKRPSFMKEIAHLNRLSVHEAFGTNAD